MSPEELIQRDCVDFTHTCCPDVMISASQNGMYLGDGKNVYAYIQKQKRLGMLPGELDLMLTWQPKQILFVEMKAGRNDATKNQLEVMAMRAIQGFDCCICYSLEEYVANLKKFYVPMRKMFYAGLGQI